MSVSNRLLVLSVGASLTDLGPWASSGPIELNGPFT